MVEVPTQTKDADKNYSFLSYILLIFVPNIYVNTAEVNMSIKYIIEQSFNF